MATVTLRSKFDNDNFFTETCTDPYKVKYAQQGRT